MALYWRTHPDLTNVDLPQTIMRPFWHPEALQLNDTCFCIPLNINQPRVFALLVLACSLGVLALAAFGTFDVYMQYAKSGHIDPVRYPDLGLAGGMVLAALAGLYLFSRMSQPRHICFNRASHRITFSTCGLLPRTLERSYDEFQGMIMHQKNLLGKRRSILALQHRDQQQLIQLALTRDNPQILAGFWSFIVQYMKPGAPLPDVPALHEYPNKTPGVLHHSTIDYS